SFFDPRLRESVRCHVKAFGGSQAHCPNAFATLIAANIAIATVSGLAIFLIGWSLVRSEALAWGMLAIALASGELGFYARSYLSETLTIAAMLAFLLFAVHAMRDFRRHDFALAGASLAMAALTRPAYLYLIYGLAALLLILAVAGRRFVPRITVVHALVFGGAAILVLSPWLVRNLVQFGDPAISKGYAEIILTQRLSYNRMSFAEWGVAWIYWLPDFGDGLARKLFPEALYAKLGWDMPTSYFYEGGSGVFLDKVMAEAGSKELLLGHLVRTYLVGDALKHALVTLPLTMRGLGVAKYLSVIGLPLVWLVGRRMHARGLLLPYLSLALPPLGMALFHGFVSVNIERYNAPIIALYAFNTAFVVLALIETRRHRGGIAQA
ncbi:MAG TPA: hypothetical protein PK264_03600, partial [Hyphomicrobiaceae bacterium]|nr:hypothetical protein [Hyphomicrobiaceae bacterium]